MMTCRPRTGPWDERPIHRADGMLIFVISAGNMIDVEGSEYRVYETVTAEQNTSLKWLVLELRLELQVPMTEVFRHPTVSRKTPTEAATAKW